MKNTVFTTIVLLLSFVSLNLLSQPDPEAYRAERAEMVNKQLLARGINHQATIDAMKKVPRHLFVPQSQIANAYRDSPLPIGYGQTISQPFIVAYMTEIVEPESGYTVLEIGTGSGYQAAILAEIVDSVFTIEIIPELAKTSGMLFSELGYDNIRVKAADGYYGWKEAGPFDAIVVTAAADHIPPPLIDQLKEGGKMIIPVGTPFFVQQLMLVKKKKGKVTTENLMPVRFVPFTRSENEEQ